MKVPSLAWSHTSGILVMEDPGLAYSPTLLVFKWWRSLVKRIVPRGIFVMQVPGLVHGPTLVVF